MSAATAVLKVVNGRLLINDEDRINIRNKPKDPLKKQCPFERSQRASESRGNLMPGRLKCFTQIPSVINDPQPKKHMDWTT